jgi:hypothetical protein
MVNDLVYVRDPALAGFRRSTLDVNFAKFKRQNEFQKCSDFLGNQKLASLSPITRKMARNPKDFRRRPFTIPATNK